MGLGDVYKRQTIIGAPFTHKGIKQKLTKAQAVRVVEDCNLNCGVIHMTRSKNKPPGVAKPIDKMYRLLYAENTRKGWY